MTRRALRNVICVPAEFADMEENGDDDLLDEVIEEMFHLTVRDAPTSNRRSRSTQSRKKSGKPSNSSTSAQRHRRRRQRAQKRRSKVGNSGGEDDSDSASSTDETRDDDDDNDAESDDDDDDDDDSTTRGDTCAADDDIELDLGSDEEGDDDSDLDSDADDDLAAKRARKSEQVINCIDQLALCQLERREKLAECGFTQPVRLRIIENRGFDEHGTFLHDHTSQTLYNEDAHADELIRSMTKQCSSGHNVRPPQLGLGKVVAMPTRLEDIEFEQWMLRATPVINGSNTVATFYLGFLPNLYRLVQLCAGFNFNPRRFAACVVRNEGGTILVFASGSAVVTGPCDPEQSIMQCLKFVLQLFSLGVPASMQCYRLQNVVSNASAGFMLNLAHIAAKFPMHADYNPKRFPGCIFRVGIGQATAIFFNSGKVILTGVKSRAETRIIWMWLINYVLREFAKTDKDSAHMNERQLRERVIADERIVAESCARISRAVGSLVSNSSSAPDDEDRKPHDFKWDELAQGSLLRNIRDALLNDEPIDVDEYDMSADNGSEWQTQYRHEITRQCKIEHIDLTMPGSHIPSVDYVPPQTSVRMLAQLMSMKAEKE